MTANTDYRGFKTPIPKIELPPAVRPSEEEIARRQAVLKRMLKLREAFGPVTIPIEKLLGRWNECDEPSDQDENG